MTPILCPVDFSEHSRQALLWASAVAQYRGSDVTVLYVIEPLLAKAAEIRLGVDLARAEAGPALREFVEDTLTERARQAARVRLEVTVGNPWEEILRTGRRLETRLLVMGTHGLGGIRKLLLGSTTERVLERTEWPVLAVPEKAGSAPNVESHGTRLSSILMATDFRDSATAATHWAASLASNIGARLVLAHVVETLVLPPRWQTLAADFEDDRVRAGQRMLANLAASLRETDTECVVSLGHPADTVASLAAEYSAGLVVLGLANPEDAPSRKPGSIAYRVLQTAQAGVVVVPGPRRQTQQHTTLQTTHLLPQLDYGSGDHHESTTWLDAATGSEFLDDRLRLIE